MAKKHQKKFWGFGFRGKWFALGIFFSLSLWTSWKSMTETGEQISKKRFIFSPFLFLVGKVIGNLNENNLAVEKKNWQSSFFFLLFAL